jgi:intracellular septation protein A
MPTMTNFLTKLLTGFVSTLAFLTAYAVTGDVLMAAVAAIASAAAQIGLIWAARRPGAVDYTGTFASLAIVLALTGTTLAGNEVDAAQFSPVRADCATQHCTCRLTLAI